MQKPEAKKAVVFLAYSADWPKKVDVNTAGSTSAFSRQWKQLELFAIVAPDAVVFLRPEATDVLTTLWKLHVKHIVDIRDVPYLTSISSTERVFSTRSKTGQLTTSACTRSCTQKAPTPSSC